MVSSLPLPLSHSFLAWGHDYGGLVAVDEPLYAWEDLRISRLDGSIAELDADQNPYEVPEAQKILESPPDIPPREKTQLNIIQNRAPNDGNDLFQRLPLDLREEITIYLSTRDAQNLRLISKAFIPIFSSQMWWASRFDANIGECGYLFEACRSNIRPRDWMSLYRTTKKISSSGGLNNRKRIWPLILALKRLLGICWVEDDSTLTRREELDQKDELVWREVRQDRFREQVIAVDFYADSRSLDNHSQVFRNQCAFIPDTLSQIGVSVIQDGDKEYVAGLRLISKRAPDIYFGYRVEGKERVVDVPVFRGFILAVNEIAIHALQVAFGQEYSSEWVGCPDGWLRTRRLVTSEPITALEAEFDVRLLTALFGFCGLEFIQSLFVHSN